MTAVLLVLHVVISAVLVTVVLLQAGRGGGLSGAFGAGGGGQALFGGRGAATFLNKATVVLGGLFFVTSLALAILSARGTATSRSLIQEEAGRARPAAGTTLPADRGALPSGGTQTGGGTPAQGGAPASGGRTQPAQGQPAQTPPAQTPPAPSGK
jgi:preprotein translocase subunit SecG